MSLVNAEARPSVERYELTSIEGGWIKVRRFDHGERIDRLSKILVMGIDDDGERGSATINHRASRLHDFEKAIVDHNLGTEDGRKYNFNKAEDVFGLDPTIGDEIDDIIGEHQEVIPEADIPKSEENSTDSISAHPEDQPQEPALQI